MLRLSWRDVIAALVLLGVLVPYLGYVAGGRVPLVRDARGMALVGVAGVAVSLAVWGLHLRTAPGRVVSAIGLVALLVGLGAAAAGTEGSDDLLALFVALTVVLAVGETLFDAGLADRQTSREDR